MASVVIGTGSWASALAVVLSRVNSDTTLMWGRDATIVRSINEFNHNDKYLPGVRLPSNIVCSTDLGELLAQARDIFVAIPSHAFTQVYQLMQPHLTAEHRLVIAAKGLDPQTGDFLDQTVFLDNSKLSCAILSGPSFAMEVAKGLPTAVTIASTDQKFANDLVGYLHSDTFRVYLSADLKGVQLGGIIKNIIAVAAGIADGLDCGANAKAALITRGLSEMVRLGSKLGAQKETLYGLSGVGDLILSCTDNQSRNRRFGILLGKGLSKEQAKNNIGQVVESVNNVRQIMRLAKKYEVDMPIVEQVEEIIFHEVAPTEAFNRLISRKPSVEIL